jgi:4-alpha-glucanotransferase
VKSVENYDTFLEGPTARQWKKIGVKRRAGVATPLFSLYSKSSLGIGEIPDLKLLGDWCLATGMSVIQLLPMNEVGSHHTPYDAQSSFALEPMYLSLEALRGVRTHFFRKEIERIRGSYPLGGRSVNYGIKRAKLELLWLIFQSLEKKREPAFESFCREQSFWLRDFALFKVLKESFHNTGWEDWPEGYREKDRKTLEAFAQDRPERLEFYQWLQWQLFEQFREAKGELQKRGILLMGDLPFLVARDSADVWANQDDFKLHLAAGAPPDAYNAKGQRWGMPPYDWGRIEAKGYDYLIQKLKYAENFYDLFRIDHFVGIFRIWTIPVTEPLEQGGLHGTFDPAEEARWEEHGRKIVSVMTRENGMLPCAEDLGVIPECSWRVLAEFGIPGIDVQRWSRDWGGTYEFKPPESYRKNSVAVISTHDMASFRAWWEVETGTVDEFDFKNRCQSRGISFEKLNERLFDPGRSRHGRLAWRREIAGPGELAHLLERPEQEIGDLLGLWRGSFSEKEKFWNYAGLSGPFEEEASPKLVREALAAAGRTASIFSIQLLQDWLSLGVRFEGDPWQYRINVPGLVSPQNWSLVLPLSLEAMLELPCNSEMKALNAQTGRI